MRYSGIQPQYFPRLHYFARIFFADLFCIRDDCQYVKKHIYPDGSRGPSYQAHTPLKDPNGIYLINTPVRHIEGGMLKEVPLDYTHDWVHKHTKTIETLYRQSVNFKIIFPEIEMILDKKKYKNLSDLNTTTIYWGILKLVGEKDITFDKLSNVYVEKQLKRQKKYRLKKIKFATETSCVKKFSTMNANEKILALCKEFGATEDYCGGTAMSSYMQTQLFRDNGIKVTVQDWKCKRYPQRFENRSGFTPNLSIIDLLMNVPEDKLLNIMEG